MVRNVVFLAVLCSICISGVHAQSSIINRIKNQNKQDTLYQGVRKDSTQTKLKDKNHEIEEVVVLQTGFQRIPQERSTGSFSYISRKQLDGVVATNIQDKLEGMVTGLDIDRSNRFNPSLKVRGLSTIESNVVPLIILDNFPYENDLSTINPNDIESITVLKDAAAASIWGARAGNGVIVITSKSGRYSSTMQTSFAGNLSFSARPDLYYDPKRISAAEQMDVEESIFKNGGYQIRNQTSIPFYVEMLVALRDNKMSQEDFDSKRQELLAVDIRQDASKWLYQRAMNQQYSWDIRGGSTRHRYLLSANYDKNLEELVGNRYNRMNVYLSNGFKFSDRLELNTTLRYTKEGTSSNGIGVNNPTFPTYLRLKDEDGYVSFPKDYRFAYQQQAEQSGLLDWLYRPLEEKDLQDIGSSKQELQVQADVGYKISSSLDVKALYNFNQEADDSWMHYDRSSYYVRNLVNRFTQADGTQVLPEGDILQESGGNKVWTHSGRLQLDYQEDFGDFKLYGLAGAEIRQQEYRSSTGSILYGYDPDLMIGTNQLNYNQRYATRPTSTALIPGPVVSLSRVIDRFVSYYSNAAIHYRSFLDFTGSVRWDASNIFGVKTNQKGVPLWSMGVGWNLVKSDLIKSDFLNELRVTMSYGSSGNVNKSVSVYPIIGYSSSLDQMTNLNFAWLDRVGNPSLRWERVNTWNIGLSSTVLDNRLSAKLEYYKKYAKDLIGENLLDPATGITSSIDPVIPNKINYAELLTKGLDVQLTWKVLNKTKFWWHTTIMFSKNSNEVQAFNMSQQNDANTVLSKSAPRVGASLDAIYALPWYGLDGETGRVRLPNAEAGSNYKKYYESFNIDDLINTGVSRAPYFGSWHHDFGYKNINVGIQLLWKAGHHWRRNSMMPGYEYLGPSYYHSDISKRWLMPGDEYKTDVPAASSYYTNTTNDTYYEGRIYGYSEKLVTPADYLRLQNIQLGYNWQIHNSGAKQHFNLRLQVNVRNVGLLWRANKNNIDPEYPLSEYPNPRITSFTLRLTY